MGLVQAILDFYAVHTTKYYSELQTGIGWALLHPFLHGPFSRYKLHICITYVHV